MSLTAGDKVGLAAVGLCAALGLLLACGDAAEEPETPTASFADPGEQRLQELLAARFGAAEAPRAPEGFEAVGLPAPGPEGDARLRLGRGTWRTQCLHCHGSAGEAATQTAALLNPRPRDFGLGIVKFTSTEAGAPALRADLERTVRDGLPYSAMSSFASLPKPALQAVVDYNLWLLLRAACRNEARTLLTGGLDPEAAVAQAAAAVADAWGAAAERVVAAQGAPPETDEARARGAALFQSAGCAGCHGADGGGRGPTAWDPAGERWLLRDAWGLPAQPRDLRKRQHRGGSRPEDLYRRLHSGVKGTPMPAHGATLTEAQIWDLVAHLRGMRE